MPQPSTGSASNAATLLSAFGEPITLEDGSVVQAIHRYDPPMVVDGPGLTAILTDSVRLERLWVPTAAKFDDQVVIFRGVSKYASQSLDDPDGWTHYSLKSVA